MVKSGKTNAVSDAWESVASLLGGTLDRSKRGQPRLYIDGTAWPVRADIMSQSNGFQSSVSTRIRCSYHPLDDFRLSLYRLPRLFGAIGKAFGMQDLIVGRPGLDRDYIIRSSSRARAMSLLSEDGIARVLEAESGLRMQLRKTERKVRKSWGQDLWDVQILVETQVLEPERLTALIELGAGVTERLVTIGSARADRVWPWRTNDEAA